VAEEVAVVLQRVVCPIGLVPSELARQIDALTPLLNLHCVKGRIQSPGEEDAARAVTLVVKAAVARLDEGAARKAADLLLGISRTRGLPRKDRRKDAADALVVGEAHFRKRRELPLLREVAEEICALERECRRGEPGGSASSAPPESGLDLQSGIRRGGPYAPPVAVGPGENRVLDPVDHPPQEPSGTEGKKRRLAPLAVLGVAALVALGVFRMIHPPSPLKAIPSTAPTEAPRPLAPTDKVFSGGDGVIYVITQSGELRWYRQKDPQNGGADWAPGSGKVIGHGFDGYSKIFSGDGGISGDAGIIYAINPGGRLFWYRYSDPAGGAGQLGQAKDIDYGWTFSKVFSAGDGVIYAVDSGGTLFWYRYSDPAGGAGGFTNKTSLKGQGTPIGRGFDGYSQIFSGGGGLSGNAGIIYAVDSEGTLFWYRYSDPAGGAVQLGQPKKVGRDWTFPTVFSGGGGGVIYAVDSGGRLFWYRHNDPAGGVVGFANLGRGMQILPVPGPARTAARAAVRAGPDFGSHGAGDAEVAPLASSP
jgi:hypothetical protein